MEYMFGTFKFQGMSGIWPTLKAGNDVIPGCEYIDKFTLAFISPLQTEEDIYFIGHVQSSKKWTCESTASLAGREKS